VSAVTIVAICIKSRRPSGAPSPRQASPLVVGESGPRRAQLLLQDAILFPQVLDDLVLLGLEPPET
jgi:hypothetical protein